MEMNWHEPHSTDPFGKLEIRRAPQARQCNIFFDRASYSGMPHIVRLSEGTLLCPAYSIPTKGGQRMSSIVHRSADGGRTRSAPVVAARGDEKTRHFCEPVWLLRDARDSNQGYTSSLELEPGKIFTVTYADNGRGTTGIVGTRYCQMLWMARGGGSGVS
jgi:hypothetical protein